MSLPSLRDASQRAEGYPSRRWGWALAALRRFPPPSSEAWTKPCLLLYACPHRPRLRLLLSLAVYGSSAAHRGEPTRKGGRLDLSAELGQEVLAE